jgi:hypothetical protein
MSSIAAYEYTSPDDKYLNYCLWPYKPVAAVTEKFRSINLLLQSFEVAGLDQQAWRIIELIRDAIGPFRTVWGTKLQGDHLAWEFYFYDYKRRQREVSITRVLKAIEPLVTCDVQPCEHLPYFMFSLDIDSDLGIRKRKLPEVHMYIGNPGSTVSSGIAYAVRSEETVLENFYFFFDAKKQVGEILEKISCSVHSDSSRINPDHILIPELRHCRTVCIANKQHNDTIYFSEVNVDQLLFFLNMLDYPVEIVHFVETNRHKLDHLLYDVGFDYISHGDKPQILKSGYYGVF